VIGLLPRLMMRDLLVLLMPLDCVYDLFMGHLLHHASKENELCVRFIDTAS